MVKIRSAHGVQRTLRFLWLCSFPDPARRKAIMDASDITDMRTASVTA